MATETSRATRAHAVKAKQRPIVESDAYIRMLVENISDYAIFTLDTEGLVTTWNTGAQRIKGYRPEEIIGRHVSCFYPEDKIETGFPEQELQIAARTARAFGRTRSPRPCAIRSAISSASGAWYAT
jgi:PAS domain-containing protein